MGKALKDADENNDELVAEIDNDITVACGIAMDLFGDDAATVSLVEQVYQFLSLYEDDIDKLTEDMRSAMIGAKALLGAKRGATIEGVLFVFRSRYIDTMDLDEGK